MEEPEEPEDSSLVAPALPSNPFTEYTISLELAKLGPHHPSKVVESSSLAAIKLPEVRYQLNKRLLKGCLSDVQLEAILLACNSHEHVDNGQRRGMLIGDGAGVGKGRTIAGIIYENKRAGRGKSIWMSTNTDLYEDAKRDLGSVGLNVNKGLKNFHSIFRKHQSLPSGDYCLFITYTAVAGKNSKEKLLAIKKWLRRGFDGVIALDECHAIKNAYTKNSLCLSKLDLMFPLARFVYCSATVAEDPSDIQYMHRLGLWGVGTAYPDGFPQIERVLARTGFLGMETMAMELKHKGCYIARRLDQGSADYIIEEVPLAEEDIQMYNKCTRIWNRLLQGVKRIPELNKLVQLRYYWAAHQRFFRLLSLSFKLDWVVTYTRKRISEGYAVVLGLQSTGFSKMATVNKKHFKKIPSTLLMTLRETVRYLLQDDDPDLAARLDSVAKELGLPLNFLDQLVNKLGVDNISELTGRSHRLVLRGNRYRWEKVVDNRVVAQRKFMTGENLIAIISDASSCGISLHASQTCENQRRRVHCTLELPWSAEKVIQQCGRTLRSNQVTSPEYVLVVTNIAGERRFGYGIAAKLQTLGAITQADRTLSVNSMENFHLGSKDSEEAILYTLQTIALVIKPIRRYSGQNIYDFFRSASKPLLKLGLLTHDEEGLPALPTRPVTAKKILNRLLGAPLPLQNKLYNYMFDIYEAIIEQTKKLGKFEQGVVEIGKSSSFVVKSKEFHLENNTLTLLTIKADQGISFEEALQIQKSAHSGKFFTSAVRKNVHIYMAVKFQNTGKFVRVYPYGIPKEDVSTFAKPGYYEVSTQTANAIWTQIFQSGDQCFHSEPSSCAIVRGESHCGSQNRFQLKCILTGILWTNLKYVGGILEELKINSLQLVRCTLADGKTVLGAHIPLELEDRVKHGLNKLERK